MGATPCAPGPGAAQPSIPSGHSGARRLCRSATAWTPDFRPKSHERAERAEVGADGLSTAREPCRHSCGPPPLRRALTAESQRLPRGRDGPGPITEACPAAPGSLLSPAPSTPAASTPRPPPTGRRTRLTTRRGTSTTPPRTSFTSARLTRRTSTTDTMAIMANRAIRDITSRRVQAARSPMPS
jgi:hypothetical protein